MWVLGGALSWRRSIRSVWELKQEEFDIGRSQPAGNVGRGEMVYSFQVPSTSIRGGRTNVG